MSNLIGYVYLLLAVVLGITSNGFLKTTNGFMQGFYLMSQKNGDQLKIDIPTFSLDSPYDQKKLH